LDAAFDGLDKAGGVADEADAVEVAGLVAAGRAETRNDAGGGDAVTVAGGGPVVAAFILDLFAAHPVPGAEPACAAVEGALQLVPKETVAEDGGAFGNNPVLRAWGGLAGVDVLEEEGPAPVVDVVFELLAGQAADFGPLLRGEFQGVKLTDGEPGAGEGAPVAPGEVAGPGLVGLAEVGGQVVEEPAVVHDGLEFTGGGTQVLVAVVGEGIPAGGDPGAEAVEVVVLEAEAEDMEMRGTALLKLQLPDAGAGREAAFESLVEDAEMVLVGGELLRGRKVAWIGEGEHQGLVEGVFAQGVQEQPEPGAAGLGPVADLLTFGRGGRRQHHGESRSRQVHQGGALVIAQKQGFRGRGGLAGGVFVTI
jgi:hypothetical protein